MKTYSILIGVAAAAGLVYMMRRKNATASDPVQAQASTPGILPSGDPFAAMKDTLQQLTTQSSGPLPPLQEQKSIAPVSIPAPEPVITASSATPQSIQKASITTGPLSLARLMLAAKSEQQATPVTSYPSYAQMLIARKSGLSGGYMMN